MCVFSAAEKDGTRRRWRCERCGKVTAWTPSPRDKLYFTCRAFPHPHELGHWLAILLEACFIRKRDYLWLKTKLGLVPRCGCDKRASALNTWGTRVRGWLKKKPDPDQEALP